MDEWTPDDTALVKVLVDELEQLEDGEFKTAVMSLPTGKSLTEKAVHRIAAAAAKVATDNDTFTARVGKLVVDANMSGKHIEPRKHKLSGVPEDSVAKLRDAVKDKKKASPRKEATRKHILDKHPGAGKTKVDPALKLNTNSKLLR